MKTLYIGALPFRCDEQTLRKILEPYGPVGEIKIFADWDEPKAEPYAYAQVTQAMPAILALDGFKVGTNHLRIHLKVGANE